MSIKIIKHNKAHINVNSFLLFLVNYLHDSLVQWCFNELKRFVGNKLLASTK